MKDQLKILLLEDNSTDAEIIHRLLKKEVKNFEFRLAMNKKEFLNCLDDFMPDVILSDNSLPQFSASAALEIIRQRFIQCPFILITGTVSEEYAAGMIKQGADDYILKDRLARLPAAIEAALRQRKAEKEKQLAEQQKEFDHNNLQALINNTNDLMWSVDRNLKLIAFNDSFNEVITLMSGKPLIKERDILSTQFTEEQRERYKILYERAFAGEIFTIIDHFVATIEVWAEISFHPIRHGNEVIGTACFSRDITERKKAEAELRRLEQEQLVSKMEEQRKITRAILITQEKERNAIGTELHDNVNQILVATNMMLSMAGRDSKKAPALIQNAMEQLQLAISENRKIAHVFVPPDLETETLVTQLENLSGSMLATAGIATRFDTKTFREDLLDDERKFNIYRIAQEQCTNIIKYARAKEVDFILATEEGTFRMTIRDNGVGMDDNKKATGIGLRNIKGRLGLFNGTATVITAPGKGFSLEVKIPCS